MTIAAETSKNAHNRPEMCGPVSKKERKLILTEMNKNHIQLQEMNMIPLLNKPYVNEVTLRGQNPTLKCC